MSVLVWGPSCEPSKTIDLGGGLVFKTDEPTHTRCPGGYHLPGVIGGWSCRCECHHRDVPAMQDDDVPEYYIGGAPR